DRGRQLRLDPATAAEGGGRCFFLDRLGGASIGAGLFSVLIQLRGRGWVEAREGRFGLGRGNWAMFERDSMPQVQVDNRGLCIGVALDHASMETLEQLTGHVLYPGLGHLGSEARLAVLHLWREAGSGGRLAALRPLRMYLEDIEMELANSVLACPGRSRAHKRQVFARLQRARMYLQGHPDHVVRIDAFRSARWCRSDPTGPTASRTRRCRRSCSPHTTTAAAPRPPSTTPPCRGHCGRFPPAISAWPWATSIAARMGDSCLTRSTRPGSIPACRQPRPRAATRWTRPSWSSVCRSWPRSRGRTSCR